MISIMSESDKCAEFLIVVFGVTLWSTSGNILPLIGAIFIASGIYLNGGWRWSPVLRVAGIYLTLLPVLSLLIYNAGGVNMAAYVVVAVVSVTALRTALRNMLEYSLARR